MNDYHQFERQVGLAWDPVGWRDVTVLVAVSGGADSVALLRALYALGHHGAGRLVVAHFDHRLRCDASAEDVRFVRQLCGQLDLACEVGVADAPARPGGDGLESAARDQRYAFLRAAADRCGARYVATAHTANDQAETILHRVVRGTGLAGLAGIPRTRPLTPLATLIRPLLAIDRAAVLAYLNYQGQSYREDASNHSPAFTRNRIRHQLLPLLEQQFNPQVVASLTRLGRLAGEAREAIDTLVSPLWDQAVRQASDYQVELSRPALQNVPPFLVRELLVKIWDRLEWPRQDMGELEWLRLGQLVRTDPAADGVAEARRTDTFPGAIRVELFGDTVRLERTSRPES